jgi:hypothetical protein
MTANTSLGIFNYLIFNSKILRGPQLKFYFKQYFDY